jgi:hypothetical protein
MLLRRTSGSTLVLIGRRTNLAISRGDGACVVGLKNFEEGQGQSYLKRWSLGKQTRRTGSGRS